jgi:membrane-associated HD superfamily phosphohydrolase
MAENKKSFIAYADWSETFNALPDDKAGKLVKHLFAYVNDENPISEDILINAVFANIKQTLKRDLKKYNGIIVKRIESGKLGGIKSGESRRTKQTKQVLKNRSKSKQIEANEADSVNDSVSVNVSVNDNEGKEKKNKYADFVSMLPAEYGKLILNHGIDNTKTLIEILNNYKGANGKKYKSDYLAILNWVIDRAKKDGKYELRILA